MGFSVLACSSDSFPWSRDIRVDSKWPGIPVAQPRADSTGVCVQSAVLRIRKWEHAILSQLPSALPLNIQLDLSAKLSRK